MTQTSELGGKGIGMLMAIHAAVRRDLGRLLAATDALATTGAPAEGVSALTAYWGCFAQNLHHHHAIEDAEVFPYVQSQLGDRAAAVMAAMDREHHLIDDGQRAVESALAALVSEPTPEAARAVHDALLPMSEVTVAHLAHEEAEAVPLILEGFDDGYWAAFLGRRQHDEDPDAFLPWVLDEAPAPMVEAVSAELPPPVRSLLVEQWAPAHAARAAALPR